MKWLNSVWCSALAGLCCLLLMGCTGEDDNEDDPLLPSGAEPTVEELGLRLVPVALDLNGLSQAEIDQVARGSYLVNGLGDCSSCHTTDAGSGYLAGGRAFGPVVVSPNLTPDAATGLQLSEDEFIESMRTGKDFADSTDANPQRLLVQPWHIFRFLSRADLTAIFAFLQRIPPVRNEIRRISSGSLPPVPLPPIGDSDPVNDPDNAQRGLLIPQFFSSGAEADAFVAQFNATVAGLTPEEQARVGRGSYLVNAIMNCNNCHTDGDTEAIRDNGLIPATVHVNTAMYLAGGVNIGTEFGLNLDEDPGEDSLFSRNLTPATGGGGEGSGGLSLSEEEFIQTMRFGSDFRRQPGGSLRLEPHFPSRYNLTLDDLKAIFAYLQAIPTVVNQVEIVP